MGARPPEFEPRTITTRDGRSVTLRAAEPADAPSLRALYTQMSLTSETGVMEPDEVMPVDRLAERLNEGREGGWLWIVAEGTPGSTAGDCIVRPEKFRRLAHNATIGLGFTREWRGVGLGRAVMDTGIAWAVAHPALRRLELRVFAINTPAIALYESCGFVRDALLPGRILMPDGRLLDEYHMTRDVSV